MSTYQTGGQIARPSLPRDIKELYDRIEVLERLVGNAQIGPTPRIWIEPTLLNGWANAGSPFFDVAYRFGPTLEGLEFRGHLEGGTSGTVAFELEPAYWPSEDQTGLVDIVTGSGFAVSRVYIEAATGEFSIEYPAA